MFIQRMIDVSLSRMKVEHLKWKSFLRASLDSNLIAHKQQSLDSKGTVYKVQTTIEKRK